MVRLYLLKWGIQQVSKRNSSTLVNFAMNFHRHRDIDYKKPEEKKIFVDEKNIFYSSHGELHQDDSENSCLHEYVWRNVDKYWNKTAVICAVTERSYTYGQLRRLSGRFATSLRKLNIKQGETIAAVLPNVAEYVIVIMGASEAGIPLTLVNPAYTSNEINHQLKNSNAVAVITVAGRHQTVAESSNGGTSVRFPAIIIDDGTSSAPSGTIKFSDLVTDDVMEFEKTGEKIEINPAVDTVYLPYSSGTTGLPKGVELTHRNIVSNLKHLDPENFPIHEPMDGYHQDVIPLILPMYHIFGLSAVTCLHLCNGGTMIAMPAAFTANGLLEVFNKYKVTSLKIVPPILQLIGNDERFKKKHLDNLRNIICGAASTNERVITKFIDKLGENFSFSQGYGLTETSPVISFGNQRTPWSSSGPLISGTQARIVENVDGNLGKNLGVNEVGEILIKGPQVMKGYLNNVDATLKTMDGEWFKTGDLGSFDENGNLTITGRLKELIKVNGYQVPPAELEGLLLCHEKIADVAVIGVPHEKFGETPKAFVVPKRGVTINENEIKNYIAKQVVHYKHLGQVVSIDQIPKSAAGKILRKELQKL